MDERMRFVIRLKDGETMASKELVGERGSGSAGFRQPGSDAGWNGSI